MVRRGKGKRFREVDVGDVGPAGGGSGAGVQIASLGLKRGDELKYVYDFGDWIEHRITLEEIVEAEKRVKYPRTVARSKPRYKNCQTCQDQGRQSRATWICIECSNRQQREVLLCKDCLNREHEDHYAEEILYSRQRGRRGCCGTQSWCSEVSISWMRKWPGRIVSG